jgi:hypothetical protein
MNPFTRTLLTVASTLALTAAPAFAQHRGGGHGNGGGRAARGYSGRSAGVYRGSVRAGGAYRGGVYTRGAYGGRYVRVAPVRFYRPYYAFRPRFSLGFGVWAGYPFAYNYGYYDPYAYGSPYAYPYAPYGYADSSAYPYAPQGVTPPSTPYAVPPPSDVQPSSEGAITAQPNQANMGGLSFDITPADAQIVVDGRVAGNVGEFTSTSQPLGLPAGHHRVEIRAAGYQTMNFDVDVVAGQVIPYQGTLQR